MYVIEWVTVDQLSQQACLGQQHAQAKRPTIHPITVINAAHTSTSAPIEFEFSSQSIHFSFLLPTDLFRHNIFAMLCQVRFLHIMVPRRRHMEGPHRRMALDEVDRLEP